ncbi:MAG: MBL fold metallo-hydrolase [Gammaproteobacteria bacterium]|nr:MBL fold metallo-hydrolase [Gammaproteobacteria bacterium]
MSGKYLLLPVLLLFSLQAQSASSCDQNGVWLQVLGSGGPELDDGRASSSYLIWHDGRARILVDMGGGSAFRFEQSGAALNDLDLILLTHMHTDHSADLPLLIKASYFSNRERNLQLYGPSGNSLMPSTSQFVQRLLGPDGAFAYLQDYLSGADSYRLLADDVAAEGKTKQRLKIDLPYTITAVPVHHGPIPALAWRIDIDGQSLVFSGDMSNQNHTLAGLTSGADLLVAHHAIPEQAGEIALRLHMPPSEIGRIAAKAGVKQLVLSHRMNRTLGIEASADREIRRHYQGPLAFADDLQCFKPGRPAH